MKKLLLTALIAATAICGGQAKEKTFTVATLNVDGMPPKLTPLGISINLNPDAKEGPGATAIGQGIVTTGWDIIALSEDFNYHNELVAPLSTYYYAGTHRGNLYNKLDVLSSPFDTDGLGLLWTKTMATTNESWTEWTTKYGKTDHGSDELIRKGFRYYTVEIAPGMLIDLYIHHMDAEDAAEDNAARASQITQLVNLIKSTHNKRPILVMGDTNCRYTRDDLKNLLYGALSADGRFTVGDPWIDFQWDGNYDAPELQVGQPSILTSNLGYQKGEVVDKIFYINDAEAEGIRLVPLAYRQAEEFKNEQGEPLSDHYPVTAKFKLINENDGPNPAMEYLLRNVATGRYIHQGNDWGTRAIAATDGIRIKMEQAGSNKEFKLHTTAGYMKPELYVDGGVNDGGVFTFVTLPSGACTLTVNGQNLSTNTTDNNLSLSSPNADDPAQQWELVTIDQLSEELMAKASVDNPMDATSFIRAANFNRNDDKSAWTITKMSKVTVNFGGDQTNEVISIPTTAKSLFGSSQSEFTIQQNVSVPNGVYKLTFQGFSSVPGSARVYANEKSVNLNSYSSSSQNMNAASQAFSRGEYTLTIDNLVVNDHAIVLKIYKENNSGATWSAIDNFRLTYMGPTPEMLAAYDYVKAAMDDAAQQLTTLEPAAAASFNNSTVEQAYNNRRLTGNGSNEVKLTYQALASAAKRQTSLGADMTLAILNRSFEWAWMGETPNTPSWATTGGQAVTTLATNATGSYMLAVSGTNTKPTTQTISGLPNGIYEIKAMAAAEDAGGMIYLMGNNVAGTPVATADPATLVEVKAEAVVSDGKLIIGIGGCDAAGNALPAQAVGCGYRADDFQLRYTSSLAFQSLQAAINDAKTKAAADGLQLDLTKWETMAAERTVQTNDEAKAAVLEVYNALASAEKANIKNGQNITNAIINPSFEFAAITGLSGFEGWNYQAIGDTRVLDPNSSANKNTYGVTPVHGTYVFNTWTDGSIGHPISQVLTDMPAGVYRLQVKVASDDKNKYFLIGGNGHSNPITTVSKTMFVEGSYEFYHEGGDMTIGLKSSVGTEFIADELGWWYKADDFRLTYLKPEFENITIEGNYDAAANTVTLTTLPAGQGITVRYLVKTDNSTPVAADFTELYRGPIDMTAWEKETASVWVYATASGFNTLAPTKVVTAFINDLDGSQVVYKPVTSLEDLKAGNWYVIASRHAAENIYYLMGLDNQGFPAFINGLGHIVSNNAGFANVHEFLLAGNPLDGWSMNTASGASPATVSRASGLVDIAINADNDTEGISTTINIGGVSLGFDPDAKTFGFSETHTSPLMLFTTGSEINTGVDNIATDNNEVEYYNLQGVRVNNPGPGLYIIKQGNKISKVIL